MIGTLRLMAFATALAARSLSAQVWYGVNGTIVSHREFSQTRTSHGVGAGVFIDDTHGRWRFQGSAMRVQVGRSDTIMFGMTRLDGLLGYRIRGIVSMEVGVSRQWIAPALAAQSVSMVSVGASMETHLARDAVVWLRGAFVPMAKFSGGGSSGASVEIGLGSSVTLDRAGRWQARADFGLERLDRQVANTPAPLQTSFARFGLARGFRRMKR